MDASNRQTVNREWVAFPGGELEGRRPKALCPACRSQAARGRSSGSALHSRTLCFHCYRAELDREHRFKTAGPPVQSALPFERVNWPRLERLKAERAAERATMRAGIGRFADRRRQAQIAARHALQSIAEGTNARQVAAAIRAAELQLPESWMPFVLSR